MVGGEPGDRAPAPGGLGLVQAFLNTVDLEDGRDGLGTPEGLRAWLAAHDLPGGDDAFAEAERARAVAVREALRALVATNGGEGLDRAAWGTLEGAAAAATLRAQVWQDGRVDLAPAVGGLDGALARVLAAVVAATLDGTWPRLKTCRRRACRWVFYDASKNRSGAWCAMAVCGSRTKARAYRARRADTRG